MYSEVLAVFLVLKDIAAVRAAQSKRTVVDVGFVETLVTYFTQILTFGTIVFIKVLVRSTAARAHSSFRDRVFSPVLNRTDSFTVFMLIIRQKKLVVYWFRNKDFRELIHLKLLILRTMRILKSPLL